MISRWPPPIPARILGAWLSRAASLSSDWSGGGARRRGGVSRHHGHRDWLPLTALAHFFFHFWNRERASSAGWFDLFPFQLHNHSTLVVWFYPECHLCPMPVLARVKLPREVVGCGVCPICVCLYVSRVFPHLVLVQWTDTMWKNVRKLWIFFFFLSKCLFLASMFLSWRCLLSPLTAVQCCLTITENTSIQHNSSSKCVAHPSHCIVRPIISTNRFISLSEVYK